MAIPVRNHTAQTVSKCLYEHVVAYFGVPRSILSDRGAEFTSCVWESLTQVLGTNIQMASPYYPQGNAVIERSHRTLNNMLRTMLLEKKGKGWSTLLPSIMLYVNSMIQEQAGVSACEILFGQNPNLPSDLSFAPAVSVMEDREGYVKQLKRELGDIRAKLSRILGQEKNQEKNPFSVGERVIITILPRENRNKLLAKWKGPFTITKVPNRFQIEYLENGITRTTHISYAKKFFERSLNVRTEWLHNRLSRKRDVVEMAHLRLVTGSGRNRRRMRAFSLAEIYRKWHYLSGPKIVRLQVRGAVEELPEGLQNIVTEAGATQKISRERLLDLCGQRSYVEGGSCDGSSVQAIREDLALSQEDGSPTAADQVGKISDSYNLTITREIPDRFKSVVGYKANHSYLDSFQTSSGSSPKLMALVRTIQVKERPTSKYQPSYVFKPKESIPAKRLASRPNWFKLAYAGNSKDKDREGFGMKSGTKAKDCFRKTNYAFWNAYMFIIICIIGNLIYFRNLVNTWQPYELPSLANRIPESYAKVEITPETCPRDRKRWDKSNKNFWNTYEYMITAICLIGIFLTKHVTRLKRIILQTTNSSSAKVYTLAKIGANSCHMVEKHIHKSHGKFMNGHSYLEWRILGFKEYLHTLMFRWRHWRLTATPSWNVYIRRTGIMESQSGLDHSHSMVSVMLLSLNLLFCCYMHLFRLRCLTVSLKDMLCWLIALNLIWLYICWHKYVRLPLCDEYKHLESTDRPCQVSLTLTL